VPRIGRPKKYDTLHAMQQEAINKLIGQPIRPQQHKETPEEELAILLQHYRDALQAELNPWQHSFTRFRTELCWTKDEAGGGKVSLMPDWPYLRAVDEMLVEKTPLLITKSRRTLITWTACAFVLWVAAGGQDPRWPSLMNATGNRKCIIAARKFRGENGSSEIMNERLGFLVQQFEERGGREKWPNFPTFYWTKERCKLSNGSVIAAVPQGENQLRGSGVTLIMADELSAWEEARESVCSALQTCRGGGHFFGICTAQSPSFASTIVAGEVRGRHARPVEAFTEE
jgi:hypothetical protein